MKLYLNGIYRNTDSKALQEELKRAGYVEVKETAKKPSPPKEKSDEAAEKPEKEGK